MKKSVVMILALLAHGAALGAGDATAGKKYFTSWCGNCHKVGSYARGSFGPELNAIFGRQAGSTEDFNYSQPMKDSGIIWNEETLAAYLKDPDKVVPGTKMRFWGISNKQQIADLLAYLATFQKKSE
ncbi:c-type cytochrome [Pseudomonas asuensis]|uniref:Cytochrome c n=1 Tax=Pseudomonas asuensis TaxID=1825787 RepID=A0ABQ2GY90_9PSED|nr:c-type cytochrome [Pseudomonas asuensis]GGM17809.1 cytochrome c [Pseudomonas asuensis]